MAKRVIYHVTKTEKGWKGEQEGGKRASVVGSNKESVVQKTIQLAKNKGVSSVRIHKGDGAIQQERSYGTDPFPPQG